MHTQAVTQSSHINYAVPCIKEHRCCDAFATQQRCCSKVAAKSVHVSHGIHPHILGGQGVYTMIFDVSTNLSWSVYNLCLVSSLPGA
jgi:hypothetical protein